MVEIDSSPDDEAKIAELREEFARLKARRDDGLTAEGLEEDEASGHNVADLERQLAAIRTELAELGDDISDISFDLAS